ncbi:MAG TPA: hypothetical protein PKJ32_07070 [Piscinibacter sp.]|nr:hypothetical protein [Piscinibacter sp.]HPV80399.1 hypothetical protein [Dermatophilaceae bacterium]
MTTYTITLSSDELAFVLAAVREDLSQSVRYRDETLADEHPAADYWVDRSIRLARLWQQITTDALQGYYPADPLVTAVLESSPVAIPPASG